MTKAMDTKNIRQLLEDYYEGKTTLEDERFLANYFHTAEVPSGFDADKRIFRSFYDAKNEYDPEISFTDLIDVAIKQEIHSHPKYIFRHSLIKIAAIGILLLSIGSSAWIFRDQLFTSPKPVVLADTYTDPQKAFEETKRTLLKISSRLNQGKSKLNHLSHFNQGMQQFNSVSFYLINDLNRIKNQNHNQ
jgi:hypothetical protein